jgi:phosphonate transport system substrate-binding protein
MTRVARWARVLLVLAGWGAGSALAGDAEPLRVGLVPNVSARTLLTAFQPMRDYLARELQRPVEMMTAPDFPTFYQRTQRKEFDVVVTPAHFAWLAMREANYTPILTYQSELRGLLIVAAESPMQQIEYLRGKKLGIVDPVAIVTLRGLQWLREHGLRANEDFSVRTISAHHNSVALAVGQGELDAAIIGSGPYRIMPEDIRARIRVVSEVASVPNATYLVRGDWPAAYRREVQQVLLRFGNESPAGLEFMKQYRYEGFKPMTPDMLKPMEPYAQQAKKLLQVE